MSSDFTELQYQILKNASKYLRNGGRLVYSTCTFAPEEDELAVQSFLQTHPEFEAEAVDAPWFDCSGSGMYRMWPHKLLGEGHFAAVLRKTEGREEDIPLIGGEKLPKEWVSFAKELGICLPAGKALLFGSSLYWVPEEMPDLAGLKVLRAGLELGQVLKNRFEPAHAWALWLKTAKNTADFPADGPEIGAYLRGEAIPGAQTGWTLITADGLSLGWAKGSGGMLKNHFPKALRHLS